MAEESKDLGSLIYTFNEAAGEALGKREGHTPQIVAPSAVKPVEHSIRWIEVYFYEDEKPFNPAMLARVEFAPVLCEPEVVLKAKLEKGGVLHALEYCNLHGIWSSKKEIGIV